MSLNLKDEVQTIIRSSIFPDNAICLQLLQEIKVIENTSKIFWHLKNSNCSRIKKNNIALYFQKYDNISLHLVLSHCLALIDNEKATGLSFQIIIDCEEG